MEKTTIEEIIEKFNSNQVRYILIGRQAVVFYGLSFSSFDYDFWVHPEDRHKIYEILYENDFGPSSLESAKKPIVSFTCAEFKIDIFFAHAFGELRFEDCFKKAKVFREEEFYIRVTSPQDLIHLKKFRKPLKEKDKQDIAFLTNFVK